MGLNSFFKSLLDGGKVDIAKQYEILREAVSGTMSDFFKARDRATGKIVGLKILDKSKTEQLEMRFRGLDKPTEGEIASTFNHPQIVTTYNYGMTGVLFSRGRGDAFAAMGEHLSLGGTAAHQGKLVFTQVGDRPLVFPGKTDLVRWDWNHVVLVRDNQQVRVYLNGNPIPELQGESLSLSTVPHFFFGGRNDNVANFEGRLDEVALYNRALSPEEVVLLYVP